MKSKTIKIPVEMWKHLQEQVDDADYCYLCDCHPSSGHDKECPLWTKPSEEDGEDDA